ncbi:MAG: rhomboid family intramembrane serine protease [Anaerolineales bacterium]|nr:rhomboid family intramembrane serine protease [Anaerolineales bacterium]
MSSYPSEPNSDQSYSPPPPRGPVAVSLPKTAPFATYIILGITVVVYFLQMGSELVFDTDLPVLYLGKINEYILQGELWRFITPILLHGSLIHIGFNMYALIIFGQELERSYGRFRFLCLYLLAGFAGNVTSFLFTVQPSIGASTAIFGLLAAEGVFLYQNRTLFGSRARSLLGNIIFVAGLNLILGLQPGIDNWGHIGGLLGGLMFAWFAGPLWKIEGLYPALHVTDKRNLFGIAIGVMLVLLIFGALAVWGMTS